MAFLCLSPPICKQGELMVLSSQGSRKDQIEGFEECLTYSKFCLTGSSEKLVKLNKLPKVTEPESGSTGVQTCTPKGSLDPVLSWTGLL